LVKVLSGQHQGGRTLITIQPSNALRVLDIKPDHGRDFSERDRRNQVAIAVAGVWQKHFRSNVAARLPRQPRRNRPHPRRNRRPPARRAQRQPRTRSRHRSASPLEQSIRSSVSRRSLVCADSPVEAGRLIDSRTKRARPRAHHRTGPTCRRWPTSPWRATRDAQTIRPGHGHLPADS